MGDVALTSPVISSLLSTYQNIEVTVLSKPLFEPLFKKHERLHFMGAHLKGRHAGTLGLMALHKDIKSQNFDLIIDLHDVLRTKFLRALFLSSNIPVYTIDKARHTKHDMLTRKTPFQKLKHTTVRYMETLEKAGLAISLCEAPWLSFSTSDNLKKFEADHGLLQKTLIGIAPFAAHPSKEWGIDKIASLVCKLAKEDRKILLFGAGEREITVLQAFVNQYPFCTIVAGSLTLQDQLTLMGQLNVMLAMDSANMHMATLMATRVVSIWGPTHHYFGFGPLNNEQYIIDIPRHEMPERPCTIYGKLKSKADQTCAKKSMALISVDKVLKQLEQLLST